METAEPSMTNMKMPVRMRSITMRRLVTESLIPSFPGELIMGEASPTGWIVAFISFGRNVHDAYQACDLHWSSNPFLHLYLGKSPYISS